MATASPQPTQRSSGQTKLTVAQILKSNRCIYHQRYSTSAVAQVRSTLAKIQLCRTDALGGHEYRCQQCDTRVIVANSCGDRNCPICRGARRGDWLQRVKQRFLAGVDHYQVVFTLPEQLRALVLGNRRKLFNLLFRSANAALAGALAQEHQMQSASLTVLHTWDQKLEFHPHVHCIVPGAGLSIDGQRMVHTKGPNGEGSYLVDQAQLKQRFAECFVEGLQRFRKSESLKFAGSTSVLACPDAWQNMLHELSEVAWVVHITAPPKLADSDTILKYLARYISGGPIADGRLISTDHKTVTFMARSGHVSGGEKRQVPIKLSQLEFTRRWCLHILPRQLTRVRYYGNWSPRNSKGYLEKLGSFLDSASDLRPEGAPQLDSAELRDSENTASDPIEQADLPCCRSCGRRLIPHRLLPRPSWSKIFAETAEVKWHSRQ